MVVNFKPSEYMRKMFDSVSDSGGSEKKNSNTSSRGRIFDLLASVVQRLDSVIHRVNHYPVDKY